MMIFLFFRYFHIDHLPVLASKSIEICPFSMCVNIRARKLYTLYRGTEGVYTSKISCLAQYFFCP
jgi:hypothetical protein